MISSGSIGRARCMQLVVLSSSRGWPGSIGANPRVWWKLGSIMRLASRIAICRASAASQATTWQRSASWQPVVELSSLRARRRLCKQRNFHLYVGRLLGAPVALLPERERSGGAPLRPVALPSVECGKPGSEERCYWPVLFTPLLAEGRRVVQREPGGTSGTTREEAAQ